MSTKTSNGGSSDSSLKKIIVAAMSKKMRQAASQFDWSAVKSLAEDGGESISSQDREGKHIAGVAAESYVRKLNRLRREKGQYPANEYRIKKDRLIAKYENFVACASVYQDKHGGIEKKCD